jgi:hypothetical protein
LKATRREGSYNKIDAREMCESDNISNSHCLFTLKYKAERAFVLYDNKSASTTVNIAQVSVHFCLCGSMSSVEKYGYKKTSLDHKSLYSEYFLLMLAGVLKLLRVYFEREALRAPLCNSDLLKR